MDTAERIQRIEGALDELVGAAQGVKGEALYRAPGADDWSLIKVLAHTAELLPYWARQAKDVAGRSENNQPFGRTHDDPDRIAAVEDHSRDSLDAVLGRIREGRAEVISTLRAFSAEQWAKTGRHSRRGEMSVAQIIDDFVVSHLDEHLAQARAIGATHP